SPSGSGAGFFASPPSSHATPARRMSSCNARSPSAPSSCTRSAPSQASGLRPSASEPGRTPMQESRDRASSDGRAPLVASLLESARTKGRKMLCASPDHQLVHAQAAVCGPQNRQYQTSGTTCRIRVQRDPSNPPIPTSGPFPAIVIRSGDMMMACSPTGIRNAAHYIDIPNNWIRGSRWAVRVGIFALVACGDAAELPPSTTRTPRERTSKISSPLGPIQVHFAAATGSSRLCTLDDVIPHVALVGGAPVYVNAEVFSSSADRILLAGFPNYIWPTGAVEPVADSIFGIVVDSDGPATAVHKPIPCNLVNLVTVHRSGACS